MYSDDDGKTDPGADSGHERGSKEPEEYGDGDRDPYPPGGHPGSSGAPRAGRAANGAGWWGDGDGAYVTEGVRPEIHDGGAGSEPEGDGGNGRGAGFAEETGETHDQKPPSHHVYLVARGKAELPGVGGWLVRLFRLDVFGDHLLTRRARIELGATAFLLVLVFLFDLAAWTLLFNAIFQRGLLIITPLTTAALFAGLLLATTVLIYERQFLTADTWGGWRKVLPAMLLRAVVLVIAALVTAQPVELLIFTGPVNRRVHDEGIRAEAAKRLRELRETQQDLERHQQSVRQVDEDLNMSFEREEYDQTRTQLTETRDLVEQLQQDLAAAERNRDSWRGSLSTWRERLRQRQGALRQAVNQARPYHGQQVVPEEGRRALEAETNARNAVNQAERNVNYSQSQYNTFSAQVTTLTEELQLASQRQQRLETENTENRERLVGRRSELEVQRRGDLAGAESEIDRIRLWITRVDRQARPGVPVYEKDTTQEENDAAGGYQYIHPSYDFFEQLRVLNNLRRTETPRWRGVSEDERAEIGDQFGLRDISAESQALWEQFQEDAALFNFSYWVVYIIALIIPLLIIAVKLLLSEELKAYFSAAHQNAVGNPEAKAFSAAEDAVRQETSHKKTTNRKKPKRR
ncbi:MAG: DUF4407 domain-containing protein [bacterium]|nr:DUF4407 domain-containing protein [bacterium]